MPLMVELIVELMVGLIVGLTVEDGVRLGLAPVERVAVGDVEGVSGAHGQKRLPWKNAAASHVGAFAIPLL